jgi:methionyl aminopeptidase
VVRNGFSVVKSLVGHGIGQQMHEEPQVPNFGPASQGPELQTGLVIAIEPMVNVGRSDVFTLQDGWTVVTADHSLSAHFEDTVALTKNGPEILTR